MGLNILKRFKAAVATVLVAVGLLLLAPVLMGGMGIPGQAVSPHEACAGEEGGNGSCCPYEDAICGLNGKNYEDKHFTESCD